jgi:hypothetical protein
MSFERARQVADAVLYEGYVLYPYRASARKNQVRWQFGVAVPRSWSDAGGCEHWWVQTECLIEVDTAVRVAGKVRFLQVQRRTIEQAVDPAATAFRAVECLEAGGRLWLPWDEAVEREVDVVEPAAADLNGAEREVAFAFPASRQVETIRGTDGAPLGRCVRACQAIQGAVRITSEPNGALQRLRLRVENTTPWTDANASREDVIRVALLGVHTLLAVEGGQFVSLLDPPDWAQAAVAACANVRTWPVLVGEEGERSVMLSSPIILYDYPRIAPESPGDLFDATEIDEILTLRTLTLTDDEQREARATDARAAEIIDRVTTMPPEILERLHGAVRSLRGATANADESASAPPWWDPGVDASVSPDTDCIEIGGVAIAKGSRVRLRPGARRADAQDMFLAGRIAVVEGVFFDVEDHSYLAVTLDADPAADLLQWHGRYLYFAPDEVEPLEASA